MWQTIVAQILLELIKLGIAELQKNGVIPSDLPALAAKLTAKPK